MPEHRIAGPFVLVLALAVGAGCGPSSPKDADPGPAAARTDTSPGVGGRILTDYGVASPPYRALRQRLLESRLLDTVAVGINDTLQLRENIVLAAAECGEANAWYRPEARRVTICYEFLDELTQRFGRHEDSDLLIAGTTAFVLLHELGHALIHVLDLPVTGREEDAVDQLAALLMLREGAVGDSLAFAVAAWFAGHTDAMSLDELAFADEHGLGFQRVYNVLCWVHGRDSTRYPEIVAEGWLTRSRADRCPAEYRRLAAAWSRLLAPHVRRFGPGPPVSYP